MAGLTLLTYGPNNVDSVLSTTLSAYVKKMSDSIFTRIPLFAWLTQKAQVKESGGASIIVPLMYAKNSTAKPYSGYGTIDTTPQQGMTAAQYKWAQYADTISISGLEERANSGDKAVINLLESRTNQAEMSLRDKLDIDVWASTQAVASDGGLGILNLPSIVDTSTAIADIAKSGNSWWQAQVTASGSFAGRGLSDMRSLRNNIMNQSVDNGVPDAVFSTQAVYEFYEGTLQPQQRFTDEKMASAGFENLRYKSAMYTFDSNVPSGNLYMLRSDNLKLYVHSKANFVTSPFVRPTNQDAKVAQLLWQGQLVCDNIRRLGKLTGVTA